MQCTVYKHSSLIFTICKMQDAQNSDKQHLIMQNISNILHNIEKNANYESSGFFFFPGFLSVLFPSHSLLNIEENFL